jgi:dTMP kinase
LIPRKARKMTVKVPYFIVFEGIDGSGKTSLSRMLLNDLEEKRYRVAWFREPGDSKWGRKIRELARSNDRIPIEEELNYFIEDRRLNVKDNILPALKQNKIVILDRYFFSTACYQGARGLDIEEILRLNREFAPEPDCTFIIDVDVDTALERIRQNRNESARLFEKASYLARVRENYRQLKAPHLHILDGSRPLETIFQEIRRILSI